MSVVERKLIMLFDINSVVEGRYYPGSFILGIDKTFYEGMQYSSFSSEEMSTFVHEYVHYLQDISTVHGVMLFQHRAKLLQLHIAIAQREESVCMPIDIENCGVPNAYAQTELLDFFEGSRLEKKIHHINRIEIENEEIIDEILEVQSDYKGDSIPRVSVYYNDEENPTTFGYNYILESMAYLVERYCFNAKERRNEFPYNACEMVCEQIYPELLVHPEYLIAVCELALMHEHSGLQFYTTLKCLSKAKKNFSNVNELKAYLDNTMVEYIEKQVIANKMLSSHIDFMFPAKVPYMKVPNIYIATMFEVGYRWREKNHFFITDILLEDNPIDMIKMWMELFPLPIFIDGISKEIYGVYEELSMIPVPLSILDYFSKPKEGCPLTDYCIYSGLSNFDINICKTRPWEQCKKTEFCPLAMYFMAFRLDEKKFIV